MRPLQSINLHLKDYKKMNLSIFAKNLRGPYMIHPEQAAAMMPIVHGILSGMHVETDEDPRQAAKKVACKDYFTGDTVAAGAPFKDKSVYVTYLDGTMTKYGTCYSYGTREIANGLLQADQDPDVIGHIIVADSGGGAADSVPELADAIKQLEKPIVSFVDGMAASACIYAISYTQKIIAAQPTNQVGCVGTMITVSGWPKVHRGADGYVQIRVYADQSEEKNADYEAALEGNTQIIKENMLNPLCEIFINDMKANRPNATDDQLKGRTYFAKDVVGTLIDQIGTFNDAMQAVIELASLKTDNNSSSQMNKYPTLESIAELQELQYAEDGSTFLQECQLQAIEAALTTPRAEENDLRSQMDSLTESHLQEVAGLNQTITERDETISQQASRIAELEAALEASESRNREEKPAGVHLDADPAAPKDEYAPAKTHAEAEAACREFLNRNK